MNAALKVKTVIHCGICACTLPRAKSFKVEATDAESAKAEVAPKIAAWKLSLAGQNCRVCDSIIKAVG
jgi:hypothetical protein